MNTLNKTYTTVIIITKLNYNYDSSNMIDSIFIFKNQ